MWKSGLACLLMLGVYGSSVHATELSSAFHRLVQDFFQDRTVAAPKLPPTIIPDKKDVSFHTDDAFSLTLETFDPFVSKYKAVFVNYCSSKSGICHHVAPEWNQFSEMSAKLFPTVGVAKVDCLLEPILCKNKRVKNFPTLRWYDETQVQNYHGVLSTTHFVEITARNMNQTATFSNNENGMPVVSVY